MKEKQKEIKQIKVYRFYIEDIAIDIEAESFIEALEILNKNKNNNS